MNKIIIFGSCNSYGLELWPEHSIPNYPDMDRLMAFLRDDFMTYAGVLQNFAESDTIKTEIEWCRANAWPSKLKEKFPNAEILNLALGQTNLANFIRLTSYLETADIDKENTKIIIEVTEPTGVTSSQDNTIKSYSKEFLFTFVGNEESVKMNEYLDNHESARYRAYMDLLTVKNLISDLKLKGYNVEYFVWDRDLWYDVINNTEPFKLFLSYGKYIEDNLKKMFEDFIKDSLLTYEEENQLKTLPLLPQGHYSKKAQDMLGTFIAQKIGDKKMKLWSYVEVEGWKVVSKKLNEWVDKVYLPDWSNLLNWTYLDVDEFNAVIPELKELLDRYEITPLGYAMLAFYPHESPIHVDLENPTSYRLNIPIRHTEDTVTEYFEVPPEEMLTTTIEKTNMETPYTWWEEKSIIRKLDEFVLTKPAVLHVHQPHKVTIHSIPEGQPRLSLTICPANDEQLFKLIK